jgi:hypothetical protein
LNSTALPKANLRAWRHSSHGDTRAAEREHLPIRNGTERIGRLAVSGRQPQASKSSKYPRVRRGALGAAIFISLRPYSAAESNVTMIAVATIISSPLLFRRHRLVRILGGKVAFSATSRHRRCRVAELQLWLVLRATRTTTQRALREHTARADLRLGKRDRGLPGYRENRYYFAQLRGSVAMQGWGVVRCQHPHRRACA